MRKLCATLGLLMALMTISPLAYAQTTAGAVIDDSRLLSLYKAWVKVPEGKTDAYLEKRIADERQRIRELIDEEIKKTTEPEVTDEETVDTTTKALDKQQAIVQALEEDRREREVDLDLLNEEERRYYIAPFTGSGSGSADDYRLTTTHAELLTKKAILEERIAALDSSLGLQTDRESRLKWQQRIEQFSSLSGAFSYLFVLIIGIILERLASKIIVGRIQHSKRRYLLAKITSSVIYAVTVVWILSKLFSEHPGAIAGLAIVGAGIAVALQDVVKDVVGWLMIIQRRYFWLGDRVSIGTVTGDVIDIGVLRTAMLEVTGPANNTGFERTGKTLYVPNSQILSANVLNFNTTSDFLKAEMQVVITYESDWKKAEEILKEIIFAETHPFTEQARAQQRRRTAIFYLQREAAEGEVQMDLTANGVTFYVIFNTPIGKRREVVSRLSRLVLEEFKKHKIELAYQTVRVTK